MIVFVQVCIVAIKLSCLSRIREPRFAVLSRMLLPRVTFSRFFTISSCLLFQPLKSSFCLIYFSLPLKSESTLSNLSASCVYVRNIFFWTLNPGCRNPGIAAQIYSFKKENHSSMRQHRTPKRKTDHFVKDKKNLMKKSRDGRQRSCNENDCALLVQVHRARKCLKQIEK